MRESEREREKKTERRRERGGERERREDGNRVRVSEKEEPTENDEIYDTRQRRRI